MVLVGVNVNVRKHLKKKLTELLWTLSISFRTSQSKFEATFTFTDPAKVKLFTAENELSNKTAVSLNTPLVVIAGCGHRSPFGLFYSGCWWRCIWPSKRSCSSNDPLSAAIPGGWPQGTPGHLHRDNCKFPLPRANILSQKATTVPPLRSIIWKDSQIAT